MFQQFMNAITSIAGMLPIISDCCSLWAAVASSSVVMQYHRKGVTALAFQPHNQCLVSASRDGTIAIWSVFQPGREIS